MEGNECDPGTKRLEIGKLSITIAQFPVIAKVFESTINHQLYDYLKENKILREEQAVF